MSIFSYGPKLSVFLMQMKAFIFTVLLSGLSTLLFGQVLPTLVITPTTIPDGLYGSVYANQTLTATGGIPPYTFSVSAGNLPQGISLSNDGVLSGTPTAAGSYSFTVTALDNSGLFYGTQAYTLVIDQAVLTITANNATMTYGGMAPSLSVSYTGFVNGDNASSLTTQPTATTTATAASPAGIFPITPGGGSSSNYTFSYVNGTLTIAQAFLTVTAVNQTMTYGGAVPALTASYSGFVNGDNASSLTTAPTITTTATSSSPTGAYPITASGAIDPNYSFTYIPGALSINPAALTITANDASMTYGGTVPSLSASYSGFVNGDNASSLTIQPTLSTTASAAGTYPITASGAVDPNYSITYRSGTLTVGKATLTVTADNKSMPLGGPLPILTVSITGFVNGDNASSLTTQPTATTTATAASPAGIYTITPSGGSSSNYTFSYVNGTLAVATAVLTIRADPAGSVYGAALVPGGSLTVSYSGFVNGDGPSSMAVQPTVTNTAFAGAPAGSYILIPSGAVNPNYTIVYVDGDYTISRAALNVTAVNQTMSFGGAVPALTASYSGFVNGDDASSLTTLPTITTTATSSSLPGDYPITASGAVDPNYTFTYQTGTMTVQRAALVVTANPASMTYGGTVPILTVSYSGFVDGDNASSLTTPPTITTTATSSSPAGDYPITASGAVDPNYTFTYESGTLTVGKATLTVAADNKSMPLGGPLPTLTVSITGFVNGDDASSLTTQPMATTTATAASPAGIYTITPSGGSSSNYSFSYVKGTLAVATAVLTITANPAGSVYGAALVPGGSLTVSYSGFVNGDGPGSMTVLPIVTNTAFAGAPVGSYTLIPSGAVNPNYAIVYVNGDYTISPATLTITANDASMTYGGTAPSLSVSYSGFVNGDNASSLTTPPTITTTATSSSPAGDYPITASGAMDLNYSFAYTPGTLTINPAALLVTAKAQTKVYGAPDPPFTYTVSGFLNGDDTDIFTGSLSRDPGENLGTYPITEGSISAGSNYTISYTGNYLTITEASQRITWAQSLIIGCNDTTQVQLTATASSGLPVTYSVSDPNIAMVSGNVLTLLQPGSTVVTATQAGDSNVTAAPAISDTVFYQATSLISQHWGDVIFFDNSSGDYVQWQWYKNDEAVAGATSPYYSEMPSLNGQYFVIATNTAGQQVQSCTLTITAGAAIPGGIKVYPNPANAGALVTVTSNYPSSALQGSILQVVDITGRVQQQLTSVQPSMKVTMPSGTGIYIINLLLASGQKASTNVLVVE